MKMLRNIFVGAAFVLLNLLHAFNLQASSLQDCLVLTPGFYVRDPGAVAFRLINATQTIEPDSILTVKSFFSSPLATETRAVCGSHTISFFPGATVKILKDSLQPLSGRIEITSEAATEPLAIRTARFSGEISDGRLLLEVTPDNGVFVAMRNRGQAWFKDRSRKIFELENGHELHFPLFGPTVEMPVISGFWSDQPSSFSAARKKSADRVISFDQKSGEASEIASDTVSDTASDSEKLDSSDIIEKSAQSESGNTSASTADVSPPVLAD